MARAAKRSPAAKPSRAPARQAKRAAPKAAPKASQRSVPAKAPTPAPPKAAAPKAPAKAHKPPAPKSVPPKPKVESPPPPPPPKKPRKPEIAPREIAEIRRELERLRDEYLREAAEVEEGAMTLSQSEMSGEVAYDEDYADAGSFTFEREKELSIGNNIRDLLEKVNHALAAIERGRYGLCESCGDPISKARLKALPYSSLCVRCKTLEERLR